MKLLVTGTAGFIGSALARSLVEDGNQVFGVDNHNDYYDQKLKSDRVGLLKDNEKYIHYEVDICNFEDIEKVYKECRPDVVVNLAAQAGVRYSIENPIAYVNSNLIGFTNILELSVKYKIKHLVYASTSSVYGANTLMPFSEKHSIGHQVSFYAATKRANELMAHSYSHIHKLPTTGLRFFTVYGPWGRPDMALFKFVRSIIKKDTIDVYNNGNHTRDFTYIDDIVDGITRLLESIPSGVKDWDSNNPDQGTSYAPWQVFNIGNTKPVPLLDFISAIERHLNIKAKINFLPLQKGDVPDTSSDVTALSQKVGYKPSTSVNDGIKNFIDWYRDYYEIK